MNRGKKRGLALLLAGIMMFASAAGSMPVSAVAAQKTAEEEAKATLLFCSDFQTPEDVYAYENISDVLKKNKIEEQNNILVYKPNNQFDIKKFIEDLKKVFNFLKRCGTMIS